MISNRRRDGGFSLLEVMVSVAIVALALVVLVSMTTNNVRAAHHARLVTTATFLARAKIAAVEDQILEEGFTDSDQEDEGDFADEGHAKFRWHYVIERVELPTEVMEKAQETVGQTADEAAASDNNPMMAIAGFLGGFMSTLIEPIRVGLQESVRRITLRVSWAEVGRNEQSFDVVAFLTDPSRLDTVLTMPAGGTQTGAGEADGDTSAGGGSGNPATRTPTVVR